MPLFLVSGTIRTQSYPDSQSEEQVTRIVIADDEEAAIGKFTAALSRDDPYGDSRWVHSAEAYSAIE